MFLYLLFEHQTPVDPAMPLRLLGYLLAIWQKHEKLHGLPLPPVAPFVLNQGPNAWTVSARFESIVSLPEDMAEEQTMSVAQELIAQGKAEGKAEGKLQGRLQLLQQLMGESVTPEVELNELALEQLQQRSKDLQTEYQARYKQG